MIDLRKDTSRGMRLVAFVGGEAAVPFRRQAGLNLAGDWAAIRSKSTTAGWASQRALAYHSHLSTFVMAFERVDICGLSPAGQAPAVCAHLAQRATIGCKTAVSLKSILDKSADSLRMARDIFLSEKDQGRRRADD